MERRRKWLTIVTKSYVQRSGLMLWDKVAAIVAEEYPDVKRDSVTTVHLIDQTSLLRQ